MKCSKSVGTWGVAGEPVRVTETLPTRIAASGHVSSLAMGMWGRVDILKCSVLLQGPTDRLSATVAWSVPKWGYRLSIGVRSGTEDSAIRGLLFIHFIFLLCDAV